MPSERPVSPPPAGQTAWQRLWPIGLVILIWAVHVAGSYLWLRAQGNVLMGWDPVGHLWRTMVYRDILSQVNPNTLFQALSLDSFRPLFFHLCAVLMYRIFGASADVAVMTNFPFFLLLLLSVYGIGRRLVSPAVGVLAAFFTSVLPLVFALTRAFYVDLALAALVAVSILLLLGVDEFRARGHVILLGLSIGLGLLTKWTHPLFVGPPLVYVLLSAPALGDDLRQQLRAPRVRGLRLGLALLGSLGFFLVWSLPNWTALLQHPAGAGLPVFWAALVALLIYSLLSSPRPLSNLVAALSLAVLLASLWYVTNNDFWKQVYQRSYGGMEGSLLSGRQTALQFILSTVSYLPRRLVRSDLSWPFALLFLLALGKLAYDFLRKPRQEALRTRGRLRGILALPRRWWIVTLWWVIPLLVFAFSIDREERSWLPVLPALCLVMAAGLLRFPAGLGRTGLIAGAVLFGVGQCFALSYAGLAGISERLEYAHSPVGPVGPLATGGYVRWPNWDWTDHRYGTAPDILERIADDARERGLAEPVLGIMVRLSQLHGDVFRYLIRAQDLDLGVSDLGETREGLVTYPRLFLNDYLVVKSGQNDFVNAEAAPVAGVLSRQPPAPFTEAFEVMARYPMPDGSDLTLYRRRSSDTLPGLPRELNPAEKKVMRPFGDSLQLVGYDVSQDIEAGRPLDLTLYWQVRKPVDADYVTHLKLVNAASRVWGETRGLGRGEWALPTMWTPGQVIADRRTLQVLPGTPPGEYQIEVLLMDPQRERELLPGGNGDALIGPISVGRGKVDPKDLGIERHSGAVVGEAVRLLGATVSGDARPGYVLPIQLFWQAERPRGKSYTVFTHLVDRDGKVRAGKDNTPADGFYPTQHWTPGEVVRDPYDIPLPPDMPAGEYRLTAGMYDALTGERLSSATAPDGEIDLGTVVVSQ